MSIELSIEKLKYPIGKFDGDQEVSNTKRSKWIKTIKRFPKKLKAEVKSLSKSQLDTPYRPGGWTVRQLVHHIADSHVNSYVRFRWTLTEQLPKIKTYNQNLWAELPDARSAKIDLSVNIITAIHARWVALLEEMNPEHFERELYHPEMDKNLSLNFMLSLYAWHCDHHLAHITELKKRSKWS